MCALKNGRSSSLGRARMVPKQARPNSGKAANRFRSGPPERVKITRLTRHNRQPRVLTWAAGWADGARRRPSGAADGTAGDARQTYGANVVKRMMVMPKQRRAVELGDDFKQAAPKPKRHPFQVRKCPSVSCCSVDTLAHPMIPAKRLPATVRVGSMILMSVLTRNLHIPTELQAHQKRSGEANPA